MSKPFSLTFAKTSEQKKFSSRSAFSDEPSAVSESGDANISFIESGKIDGGKKKSNDIKEELVIPAIPNREIFAKKATDKQPNGATTHEQDEDMQELSLDQLARRELLLDAEKSLEERQQEQEEKRNQSLVIPVDKRKDDILDVGDQPDKPSDEDYEQVPVTAFGQAMLRGMGWSQGGGIGNRNSGVIKPMDVTFRPKGMGLGALPKKVKKAEKTETGGKEEEKLEIAPKKFVVVTDGSNKGLYGEVDYIDGNTGRVFVKLPVKNQTVSISENLLEPVSAAEYKKSFRYINQNRYDEYKAKLEKEEKEREKLEERRSRKDKRRSRSRSRSETRERRKSSPHKESRRKKSRSRSRERLWVRPLLKVRCIDPKYKSGLYYKKKMVVIDVVSYDVVACKSEESRVLEEIHPSKLESVIPKMSPAYVMIVRGKQAGKVAEIRARDKRSCMATVEILPDREKVIELSYDDICEYVGDVE